MEFSVKLVKSWDIYSEVLQTVIPGIIKSLIDGIAFI